MGRIPADGFLTSCRRAPCEYGKVAHLYAERARGQPAMNTFKFYLSHFADYDATYGSLGGAIVLMLWFYVSGLSVLVGAEMNAEIEHASPYGKDPGEKVAGQKKKLGTAAARAYEKKQHGTQPARGVPSETTVPHPGAASSTSSALTGGLVFMITRWLRRRPNQ